MSILMCELSDFEINSLIRLHQERETYFENMIDLQKHKQKECFSAETEEKRKNFILLRDESRVRMRELGEAKISLLIEESA